MSFVEGAITQAKVWNAYLRLNQNEEAVRYAALQRMVEIGKSSVSTLQFALKSPNSWRVQCCAAVGLHRLQQPEGMAFLTEAFRWKVVPNPELLPDVETAFLQIGVPDASLALLDVWNRNADWRSENLQVSTICKIWGILCDPRVLDALCQQAIYIPDLFENTAPRFGQMAILHLSRMLRDPDINRRLLAIQTLRHIPVGDSYTAMLPLLRDPSPEVRAAIPAALTMCGPQELTKREIQEALRAGYSSAEAIQCLISGQPVPNFLDATNAEVFLQIIERWNPHSLTRSGDSAGAILAILPTMSYAPLPSMRVASALCNLLAKKPGGAISAEIARVFTARPDIARIGDTHANFGDWEVAVYNSLLKLLSSPDPKARIEAANALQARNDSLGQNLLELLQQRRPQGNLFSKFQSILRGGGEAGQFANQAVQQLTQWLNKVSREAFEKQKVEQERQEILRDPRAFTILYELLENCLDHLQRALNGEEIWELTATSAAAIKILAFMEPAVAKSAQPALIRAFNTVKHGNLFEGAVGATMQNQEVREVGSIVRIASAEALFQIYGESAFVLFLDALYAPSIEVRGTAITSLGRLGEGRALSHLQLLANDTTHPLASAAQEAIATIKRINPHYMTLLRPSSANAAQSDHLLRPVMGGAPELHPEQLLRPTHEPPKQ